jgi:hypothetical protein
MTQKTYARKLALFRKKKNEKKDRVRERNTKSA